MKRWLPLLIFLVLGLLLWAGIRLAHVRDPNAIPSPLIGKSLPSFSLPDLHDPQRRISSESLLGTPFLLNIWASWCPECRVEHPLIDFLARQGKVRVIGYNYKDDPDEARQWLQRFGDPYARILVDESGRNAIDLGIYAAPETFFVDARGIVRFKHIGALTPEIIAREILPRLESGDPP